MEKVEVIAFILSLLMSTLRVSTPLIFASFAGLLSERSGVVQIALEGLMLWGALVAATVAHLTGSAWLGFFSAMIASALLALIKAFFVLKLKTDQIVTGTALNIFVMGAAPFITKILFDSTGQTPALPTTARFQLEPMVIAFLFVFLVHFLYQKSKVGLWLRFAGEAPMALLVSGVSPLRVRWWALGLCGALCGMGGASLSLYLSSSYSPMMTAGRGFMALAALIFGGWRPLPTLFACLMFGFTDALQMRLQGVATGLPVQLVQILPYLLTIFALAGFWGKSRAPKALGQNLK